MFSTCGAIIILGLIQQPINWFTKFLSLKFFVSLGVISYSVYLYHTTIFGGLDLVLKPLETNAPLWILKSVIKLSVALGVGWLSYRSIELKVLNHFSPQKKFDALRADTPRGLS